MTLISPRDNNQVPCSLTLDKDITCIGRADVVRNNTVYELKFINTENKRNTLVFLLFFIL